MTNRISHTQVYMCWQSSAWKMNNFCSSRLRSFSHSSRYWNCFVHIHKNRRQMTSLERWRRIKTQTDYYQIDLWVSTKIQVQLYVLINVLLFCIVLFFVYFGRVDHMHAMWRKANKTITFRAFTKNIIFFFCCEHERDIQSTWFLFLVSPDATIRNSI